MRLRYLLFSFLVTVLAGCATPYGQRLAIDHGPKQIAGSITVSDAKLYRREALIDERRREMQYIDRLMAKTEEDGFTIGPEISREIEVIQSLALSLGLSFDPAAGRTYRDADQTTAIQQEIRMLQLQLQLDQLRRDATLFRDRLASQTDPSRGDLGAPTAPTDPAAPPPLAAADVKDLVARIDGLRTALEGRLGASVGGPRSVTLQGNPINQFRDRAAYRQLLASARNAASLDELHDMNGTALYRLSFQVSTLPPEKAYLRTAGIVSMRPVDTDHSTDDIQEIYARWIDYIQRAVAKFDSNDPLRIAIETIGVKKQLFGNLILAYDDGIRPKKSDGKIYPPCQPGLRSFNSSIDGCGGRLVIPVPNFPRDSETVFGENLSISQILSIYMDDILLEPTEYNEAMEVLAKRPSIAIAIVDRNKCTLRAKFERDSAAKNDGDLGRVDELTTAATSTLLAVPTISQMLLNIHNNSHDSNVKIAVSAAREKLYRSGLLSANVVNEIARYGCRREAAISLPKPEFHLPLQFQNEVEKESKIRIYEIGPREQVQQVSTAARAAEAFSLAMALAAKAPSRGAAADAGLGYSRSAIGKVDAVERLPVVVGFAQAGSEFTSEVGKDGLPAQKHNEPPQFGWILGPRLNTIDAKKGRLDLEQGHQVYDLSADLAVSGWRTNLALEVRTAWSPDWRSNAFASVWNLNQDMPIRTVIVELRPSDDEFLALTMLLAGGDPARGQRPIPVASKTLSLTSCAASTLIIEGRNLWRATDAIIDGQRMGGERISVLPDMNGITLDVPAGIAFGSKTLDLQILTPFGVAPGKIVASGPDSCEKEDSTDGPAVTGGIPAGINLCSSPTYRLSGRGLDQLDTVELAVDGKGTGVKGVLAKGTAELREVSFDRTTLKQIVGGHAYLHFALSDGKPLPTSRAITVVSQNCGQ